MPQYRRVFIVSKNRDQLTTCDNFAKFGEIPHFLRYFPLCKDLIISHHTLIMEIIAVIILGDYDL